MKIQRGISLIEMLIAITIGLVLVLGLGVVFLSLRKTSDSRQNMSDYLNKQSIAMSFLNASVRNAGYFTNPVTNTPSSIFPVAIPFSGGQFLIGGSNTLGDTISVRFVADTTGNIQGCSGQLTVDHTYSDVFSIANPSAGVWYLQCAETDTTAAAPTQNWSLISGVTGMTIMYGVDTNSSGSVNDYLTAAQITSWSAVKSVTVKLIFANPITTGSMQMVQTFSYMNGR